MAGPQFVGPTGAQFNQQNIQTMQQGIESIANMGKFLESQRQYNESQKLLVDKFHQEQLQNLQEKYQKMFDQKVKDSVGGTAMDVATTDPGFFTDYMSIISGKDKASAEQELNNVMSQDNNPEARARWFMQFGGVETPAASSEGQSASSDAVQSAANAIAGTGMENPSAAPAAAAKPPSGTSLRTINKTVETTGKQGASLGAQGELVTNPPGTNQRVGYPKEGGPVGNNPQSGNWGAGTGEARTIPYPPYYGDVTTKKTVQEQVPAAASEGTTPAKEGPVNENFPATNVDYTVTPKDKPITIVKKANELKNLGKITTADFIRMQNTPEERSNFVKAMAGQMNKGSWWQALDVVTGRESNKSMMGEDIQKTINQNIELKQQALEARAAQLGSQEAALQYKQDYLAYLQGKQGTVDAVAQNRADADYMRAQADMADSNARIAERTDKILESRTKNIRGLYDTSTKSIDSLLMKFADKKTGDINMDKLVNDAASLRMFNVANAQKNNAMTALNEAYKAAGLGPMYGPESFMPELTKEKNPEKTWFWQFGKSWYRAGFNVTSLPDGQFAIAPKGNASAAQAPVDPNAATKKDILSNYQ